MLLRIIFILTAIYAVNAIDIDIGEIISKIPKKCIPSFDMFDASAKVPSGLSSGNFMDIGNFDQCINSYDSSTKIKGQYCMVKFRIPPSLLNSTGIGILGRKIVDFGEPEMGLRDVENRIFLQTVDPTDKSLGLILGWCLPHTCPVYELTNALTDILQDFSEELKITPLAGGICQTKDNLVNEYNASKIIFIVFLAITLFLMCVSTLYDVYLHYSKKKPAHIILLAFSVKSNGEKLLSVSNNSDQLGCLHGIRVLSIMWVVLGHKYNAANFLPNINVAETRTWITNTANMYMMNAPVSVDSFFVLSGILVGYVYCLARDKGVKFNIIMFYIHRYLRLTPSLAVVVWFHATIFELFGSGPFWPFMKGVDDLCVDNWWATLLYIQNYYKNDKMCLGQSWYLAVDFQLFILSPIILIPLWKWPKKTMIASAVLVLGSVASSFAVTYVKELAPFDTNEGGEVNVYYMATYTRYGPWLMGLMLGYYLFKWKENKKKINMQPALAILGWILAMVIFFSVLYGGHPLLINPDNRIGNSFFNGLHRHGWTLGLLWVVFACTQGYGGFVNTFLSWSFFQVLSRFTYSIYLVHMTVQFAKVGLIRTSTHFSDFVTMNDFWGDFIFSLGIGALLTLAYESPMITIEKVLFGRGRKSTSTNLPVPNSGHSNIGQTNKGFQTE